MNWKSSSFPLMKARAGTTVTTVRLTGSISDSKSLGEWAPSAKSPLASYQLVRCCRSRRSEGRGKQEEKKERKRMALERRVP
ncbi:hypothetical protein HZ326_22337 [Fusarium oxysporum f. sp. albedinis]|nr:hypothetical protein HZ326_22337 [Fusarium oxysporum f. sp. albedinis]